MDARLRAITLAWHSSKHLIKDSDRVFPIYYAVMGRPPSFDPEIINGPVDLFCQILFEETGRRPSLEDRVEMLLYLDQRGMLPRA